MEIDINFKFIPVMLFAFSVFGRVDAAIISTLEAGKAVSSVDRTATFDDLGVTVSNLLGYTEDSLLVSVNDVHSSFTGKHYGRGGNNEFVTISTIDGADFFGLELDLYTGYASGLHNVVWEARKDSRTIDSGILFDVFALRGSQSGNTTTLGFYDLNLFDTFLIGAGPSARIYDQFGEHQAISLDNVRIDFRNDKIDFGNDLSPVPIPAAVWLFGTALIGLVGISRRRKVA